MDETLIFYHKNRILMANFEWKAEANFRYFLNDPLSYIRGNIDFWREGDCHKSCIRLQYIDPDEASRTWDERPTFYGLYLLY